MLILYTIPLIAVSTLDKQTPTVNETLVDK